MDPLTVLAALIAIGCAGAGLWLVYRATSGAGDPSRPAGATGPSAESTAAAQSAQPAPAPEHWLCPQCRSLNRLEADRCYRCRLVREPPSAGQTATEAARTARPRWRAVAVEPVAFAPGPRTAPTGAAAELAVEPAGAAAIRALLTRLDGGGSDRRTAIHAASAASGETPAAVTPQPDPDPIASPAVAGVARAGDTGRGEPDRPASRRTAAPGPDPMRSRPAADGPRAAAAPAQGPIDSACPFLGVRDDPSTWFAFPHPGNVCHAIAVRPEEPRSRLRLLGAPRHRRDDEIPGDVQATLCLTDAFRTCPRFRDACGLPPGTADVGSAAAQGTATGKVARRPGPPDLVGPGGPS